jgi:hypothetical protein
VEIIEKFDQSDFDFEKYFFCGSVCGSGGVGVEVGF